MAMISPALEAYAGQLPYCRNETYSISTSLKQNFPSAEAFSCPIDHILHIEAYSILMSLKQDFPSAEAISRPIDHILLLRAVQDFCKQWLWDCTQNQLDFGLLCTCGKMVYAGNVLVYT